VDEIQNRWHDQGRYSRELSPQARAVLDDNTMGPAGETHSPVLGLKGLIPGTHQYAVMVALIDGPKGAQEIAQHVGMEYSRIKSAVQRLAISKRIVRDQKRTWRVAEDPRTPMIHIDGGGKNRIVDYLEVAGPATCQEVSDAVGLSNEHTYRQLVAMTEEGGVEKRDGDEYDVTRINDLGQHFSTRRRAPARYDLVVR
jgi:predicted Rossmann fold nucleotide-binding protein DprA/Smf involved in DNA uptake